MTLGTHGALGTSKHLRTECTVSSLTPGSTTAPMPPFSFDLPLPPRPDSPAPRGLRLPGNPDPRPYTTHKERSVVCAHPQECSNANPRQIVSLPNGCFFYPDQISVRRPGLLPASFGVFWYYNVSV